MRRSDGGERVKLYAEKTRKKFFFLREFCSRALLAERLGQSTNTEESRLKNATKKKKIEDSQSL